VLLFTTLYNHLSQQGFFRSSGGASKNIVPTQIKVDSFVIVGVPRESYPGERRVGLVPMVVPSLLKAGVEVVIEAGAGMEAGYPDQQYVEKGAKILPDRAPFSLLPMVSSRCFATARTTLPARLTSLFYAGARP